MTLNKIGRYEVVAELGRGAMGVVYKATDPNIGRQVALKTMRVDFQGAEHDEMLQRFRQEARAAGLMNHPNIVTIYDANEADGLFYIAMEYIEGVTLHSMLVQRQALTVEKIIDYTRQICSGLDYAHSMGVVHRDVKPANIMITAQGAVKIMDFGIAKSGAGLTSDGRVLGTPSYMAPEQVKGRQLDGRSDLFGLGVMLYEMVTGEKPFAGENITTIIYKIVNEHPIPPRELDSTIHPGLSAVIMKALAKAPEERYQKGFELARDLGNYKSFLGAGALSGPSNLTAPLPVSQNARVLGTTRVFAADTAAVATPPRGIGRTSQSTLRASPTASASAKEAAAYLLEAPTPRKWPAVTALLALILLALGTLIYRTRPLRNLLPALRANVTLPAPAPPATGTPPAPAPPAVQDAEPIAEQAKQDAAAQTTETTPTENSELDKAGSAPPISSEQPPSSAAGTSKPTAAVPEAHELEAGPGKSSHHANLTPVGATIKIDSQPAGANIELDGADSGKVTPASIKVPRGTHWIMLKMNGYLPSFTSAKLGDGEVFTYSPNLKSQSFWSRIRVGPTPEAAIASLPAGFGMVDIRTRPAGALVAVNGRSRNKVTPQHGPFPVGDYQISLTLDGYRPVTRKIHVEDRKLLTLFEGLQPR
jgi:eukaryotic-like serine/threonine-protein kinase